MQEETREKIVKIFLKIGNFFYVQPLKTERIYGIIGKNIRFRMRAWRVRRRGK